MKTAIQALELAAIVALGALTWYALAGCAPEPPDDDPRPTQVCEWVCYPLPLGGMACGWEPPGCNKR